MSQYRGNVQETSKFIQVYMCQSIGGVYMRQEFYTGLYVSEYWGCVHETSNFIQVYMCQSNGVVCRKQVTLYMVTCARVLGTCVGDK